MTEAGQQVLGLRLSPAERLSRVQSDLRLGLPCVIKDVSNSIIAVSVEAVSKERLFALTDLFGQPQLVLTGRRASIVGRGQGRDFADLLAVRVRPPQQANLAWYHRLADTSCDRSSGAYGPIDVKPCTNDDLAVSAVKLMKLAHLIPAALVFAMGRSVAMPADLLMSDVSVTDIVTVAVQAPVLSPIARAGLPIAAHDTGALTVFRDQDGFTEHYAYEIGTPDRDAPVLARLHSACFTGDVLGSLKCDCGPQLRVALTQMGQEGAGVLLYLNQEGRGIGLANKMRVYDLQAQGFDTVEANHRLGFEDDERDFRVGATMLRTLGFEAVRLLTNNPRKVRVLGQKGLRVVERVPLRVGKNPHNEDYLAIKAEKSGHAL